MSTLIYDLDQLYESTFGIRPFRVNGSGNTNKFTHASGSALTTNYLNKEIWLPTKFTALPNTFEKQQFFLPYSVIKISGKKTIVKTAMAERSGTVKELYSTDDYSISLKGFFIDDKNRTWPEADLKAFRELFELQSAFVLNNALTDVFLGGEKRVVIESFDLPEVEGGRKHIRPFDIQLESDSIFTLEVA
ncbi:hypothetical protein A4H97_32140 [Niastella yeongjuensis]|uniref:DUF6046 domain-containing protein n=1 Tax=Niastella yeongjuensis TaxID=354355 RepID=A0A1V9EID7_9BACT|nr:DUF6046 domain-containing protein [Niastella yeongjuensis]OQP45893.1 hypothetical protein A4H97_32140 [Niastella yeongjuensis]SEP46808.1 hypothetical protein SAMN05660816_06510 [Niastella yeongjuensis]